MVAVDAGAGLPDVVTSADVSAAVAPDVASIVTQTPVSVDAEPSMTSFPSMEALCHKHGGMGGCGAFGDTIPFKANEKFLELRAVGDMCAYTLALHASSGWYVLPISFGRPACGEGQEEIRARVTSAVAKGNDLTIKVSYEPATNDPRVVHCEAAAEFHCQSW
jgi:hypothetical protein